MGVLQAGANRGDLYEIYLDLAEEWKFRAMPRSRFFRFIRP